MGRVHVIVTSPRVAPGLLSAEAWALLTGSARAAAPDLADPIATAVRRAGVEVTELAGPTVLDSDSDRTGENDRNRTGEIDRNRTGEIDRNRTGEIDHNRTGPRDSDGGGTGEAEADLVWLAPHGETGWARRVAAD